MLHAPDQRDRPADRAALAATLGTLGTYLDKQGFGRAGLLVLFDEAALTIAGPCADGRDGWATQAMPVADLASAAARRTGFLARLSRAPRLAPLLRALGALLDERCYLRRGLTLQFGQRVILVSGLALADGAVSTPFGHESAATLLLDAADLAPYRSEG